MTVASGKVNLQSKLYLIPHMAKVKAVQCQHVTKFFSGVFTVPFKSNALKIRKKIYF